MAEIEELKKIAEVVHNKKGRMDARERERSSHLIATVFTNESLDPSEILPLLEVFQSEAVAQAVGQAWPSLSGERRELFSRWLPEPKSEKTARRIAVLVAAIVEVDGVTALSWLGRLIPHNPKGKTTRETCQILASALFGSKPLRFIRLGDEGGQSEYLVRVLKGLLQVAVDDHCAVEQMPRYRLIEDILTIISRNNLVESHEWAIIFARIEAEIKRWPQALIQQLVETLKRRIPDGELLVNKLLPKGSSVTSTLDNIAPGQSAGRRQSEEHIGATVDMTQIRSTLERHITSLTSQFEELRVLDNLLREEERVKKALERQLQETELRESSLQARVGTMFNELEDIATRLTTANIRIEELERANKLAKDGMETERQRLAQQISANALGRVEEFKNNLALVLSRLIRDLPARDAHLTVDVGNIVFLQFHQFLDVMDAQGVKIRKGKGAV
jgi:hypothetical protein